MKRYWERLAQKVDAMTLRERTLVFAVAAVVLLSLVNLTLLDPQYAQQKGLVQQLTQNQARIAALNAEIQARTKSRAADPDAENRARLRGLQQQAVQLNDALQALQKGLVSPDKVAGLLESILKQSGNLQLVSLKTLPATGLNELPAQDKAAMVDNKLQATPSSTPGTKDGGAAKAPDLVYKHGVVLTIRGRYADILDYLTHLEGMSWQLFWSRASLKVDEYPNATLTLTLFTLSMEKQWLQL